MTCFYLSTQKNSPMKIHRFNIENYFCLNQVRATLFGFYSLLYIYKRRRVNNKINTKKINYNKQSPSNKVVLQFDNIFLLINF